jgi:biopolymer transport protein ExbD
MKLNLDSPTQETRIEIIPLIDVIFCVLTFFILAAVGLTRQSAINVDLPRASTGTSQMREMMVVSVDTIGQIYVEQEPVTRNQLLQELESYRVSSPDGLIVLYASRSTQYNNVVEVLDLLRTVGGDRVALATLPETSTNSFDPSTFPGSGVLPNLPSTDPTLLPGLGNPGSNRFPNSNQPDDSGFDLRPLPNDPPAPPSE